jgi:glycine cleavage system H protein
MSFPARYKYTKEHEWIDVNGSEATVGITSFAQSELGEVVFVELPVVGATIVKGATLCVVESTKAASDVYAPVSGTVIEVNSTLVNDPSSLNSDPHGAGWLVKLANITETELTNLLDVTSYTSHVNA